MLAGHRVSSVYAALQTAAADDSVPYDIMPEGSAHSSRAFSLIGISPNAVFIPAHVTKTRHDVSSETDINHPIAKNSP